MNCQGSIYIPAQANRLRIIANAAALAVGSHVIAFAKGDDGLITRCTRVYSLNLNGISFRCWIDSDHWFNVEPLVADRDFDVAAFTHLVKDILSQPQETQP